MRIFYDCEFLEDGRTVDLISIGMVAEDGRELYAVNADMPVRRIRRSPWLMENVVPSLPRAFGDARMYQPRKWLFNYADPCVYKPEQIADKVRRFIQATPEPQLWADYGAYDHVVLCQLWGRMIDLPEGVPMWTHDLRQVWEQCGEPDLPRLSAVTAGMGEHNALHDAREARYRYDHLMNYAKPQTGLDKVQAAVRRSRGGDAPAQVRGFA